MCILKISAVRQGLMFLKNFKARTPPLHYLPSLPSPLIPSPPALSVPLEVGHLKFSGGEELGSAVSSPIGVWSPSQSRIWCILALNMTSGGNSFNYFTRNQLAKFIVQNRNTAY